MKKNKKFSMKSHTPTWLLIISICVFLSSCHSSLVQGMALGLTESLLNPSGSSLYNSAPNTSVQTVSSLGTVPDIDVLLSNPLAMQNHMQKLAQISIAQVYNELYNEYLTATQFQRANGVNITFEEYMTRKGAAIQALKEEGIDIVQEAYDEMRKNRQEVKAQQEKDRKARTERNKQYLQSITGISTNFNNQESSRLPSSETRTINEKSQTINAVNSNVNKPSNYNNYQSSYDSHQQFKTGILNVNASEYKYIKKVSLYKKDGTAYKEFRNNVELLEKKGHRYISLGNTFYLVQFATSNVNYRHKISYGGVALYFND